MEMEHFWKIVELSRSGRVPERAEEHMARQLDGLRRHLLELVPEEIVDFRDHLLERMDTAFQWDLWGAAYSIAGGCSDDGFTENS